MVSGVEGKRSTVHMRVAWGAYDDGHNEGAINNSDARYDYHPHNVSFVNSTPLPFGLATKSAPSLVALRRLEQYSRRRSEDRV
jgi:hypothetical protein